MKREEFIEKMFQLAEELNKSNQPLQISMIINNAEKLCLQYESDCKKNYISDVVKNEAKTCHRCDSLFPKPKKAIYCTCCGDRMC